eukprot:TRINITY_DN7322_c0_g1_i2.p1 TRINITY_DN7322_c0_g1~~TRINITY_DN7322_c0_g1_i2.p1  ORF type:complete len:195 (+),score=22.97 TRINITY_DN7322_c0_g1_i2:330-914(+)
MLMINSGKANSFSCQNYQSNNCNLKPGYCWGLKLKSTYQTPAIQARFPFLTNYCERTSVECNDPNDATVPNATVTGNCSGLALLNYMEIAAVTDETNTNPFFYASFKIFPAVLETNVQSYFVTSNKEAKFIDPANGDYGINDKTSSNFRRYPKFRSCPRSAVGPKPVPYTRYKSLFNRKRPVLSKPPKMVYLFC